MKRYTTFELLITALLFLFLGVGGTTAFFKPKWDPISKKEKISFYNDSVDKSKLVILKAYSAHTRITVPVYVDSTLNVYSQGDTVWVNKKTRIITQKLESIKTNSKTDDLFVIGNNSEVEFNEIYKRYKININP